MKSTYTLTSEFPGWTGGREWISQQILNCGSRDILEIGSGANPTLQASDFEALGIRRYTTNDVSTCELAKAPAGFEVLCCDFSSGDPGIDNEYDFIFSRMVNEHVQDGRQYYENIFRALRPGGITVHAYSTLYALPFLVNRLVPEFVSSRLLNFFSPRDRDQHEKFKAYYSWSRGPSKRQISLFESLGFEVLEFTGYFGHSYYEKRLAPLHWLEKSKAQILSRWPHPTLTAYATNCLRKPS